MQAAFNGTISFVACARCRVPLRHPALHNCQAHPESPMIPANRIVLLIVVYIAKRGAGSQPIFIFDPPNMWYHVTGTRNKTKVLFASHSEIHQAPCV
jgi:hypothetical protein